MNEVYIVKLSIQELGELIGCNIPINKDPYDDFDTDEAAAKYGDEKQHVINAINWIFEKIDYAFDWNVFYIIFHRGKYSNEPIDDEKYNKFCKDTIIAKSGKLSKEQISIIQAFNFKPLDIDDIDAFYDTYDITEACLNLSDYYTTTE